MKSINVYFIIAILFLIQCTTSLKIQKVHNHKHNTQSNVQSGKNLESTIAFNNSNAQILHPNIYKLSVYPRSV